MYCSMKKIITLFLTFCTIGLMAQFNFDVSGYVSDEANSTPIPDQIILISVFNLSDSVALISGTAVTDENGFYEFGGDIQEDMALLHIGTYDCNMTYMSYSFEISANNSSVIQDFEICTNTGNTCEAYFEYFLSEGLTVEFDNLSTGNNLTYYWDFGDGTNSDEENPVHVYNNAGEYYVVLIISSGDSTCIEDYQEWIYVEGGQGECEAYFEYFLSEDLTVEFDNLSSGNNLTYYWDFGDGNFSQEENPEHTYIGLGIYEICLAISSNDSTCYDMYCESIVVNDSGYCLAQYAYYPDSSQSDYTYQFIDLSYGEIDSWYWDFGDGSFSEEQNPVHTFISEGNFYVCLTITQGECQSTWCEYVSVTPLEDCFNYFTYEGTGNSVLFEGFHSNTETATYFWEFGDGLTAQGKVVDHTYSSTGTYFVSLISSDEDSCTAISSQIIAVGDSIEYNQVYGQVFEGNFPLNEGMVMIFSMDTDSNYIPFNDMTLIDSSGVYVFPYVPNGEFAIYAIPLNFNGYLPTYYGDVVNWDDVTPIVLGNPNNPYNINLVPAEASTNPGIGSIVGFINDPAVREDFINKVTMLLYNEDHEPINYAQVNTDGSFSFTDLADGTYFIYPELTGVSCEFIRVDIVDGEQVVVNMTMEGNSILGTNELKSLTNAGDIFPNPLTGTALIELTNTEGTLITVQVLDITGRNQYIQEYNVNVGRSVINIPMEKLKTGLYIVRISNNKGDLITKKVIRQ
ncbi:MAG: hypothetical protein C0591_00480 [Marinilabiliales bacterium]|nr:MAG: hypothetical protein C0591_00480 [Marinilabiliales bacterium]